MAAGSDEVQIPGVTVCHRHIYADERGTLAKLFPAGLIEGAEWENGVEQVNSSRTPAVGTVRGLHYQLGQTPEFKLVACVSGEIWDVVLDLRKNSPTFLRWQSYQLSAMTSASLLIPPGCAHGFQSLSPEVEIIYCHSAPYERQKNYGVNPLDPRLGIPWPLSISHISESDRLRPGLDPSFEGLEL